MLAASLGKVPIEDFEPVTNYARLRIKWLSPSGWMRAAGAVSFPAAGAGGGGGGGCMLYGYIGCIGG